MSAPGVTVPPGLLVRTPLVLEALMRFRYRRRVLELYPLARGPSPDALQRS